MALIIINGGKILELTKLLATGSYKVHLLAQPVAITRDTTTADLVAAEAGYVGYSPQDATDWTTPAINTSNYAQSTATALNWLCLSIGIPEMIYGYFLLNESGDAVGAEIFPTGPYAMTQPGNNFSFSPQFSLGSITDN